MAPDFHPVESPEVMLRPLSDNSARQGTPLEREILAPARRSLKSVPAILGCNPIKVAEPVVRISGKV